VLCDVKTVGVSDKGDLTVITRTCSHVCTFVHSYIRDIVRTHVFSRRTFTKPQAHARPFVGHAYDDDIYIPKISETFPIPLS